ncbi:MAG TPA: chromosomal replication initiator protein DnaA, partial [Phycisphaerae bacterium]|nr:chromosomal replication initiator protein DnaA [Phycisphaerae bacterium]
SKRDFDMQAEIVKRTTQGRVRPRKLPANQQLKYRLRDFVVGPSNYLAYQAALNAANPDNRNFTQLFVHGPCGVGKTHLLQGICNELASAQTENGRPLRWRYVTGEQFTNEFIAAVRTQKAGEFREKYRSLDLLAIDDVHFLAAKRATQDEFLHTFNAIESAGRQIILASDSHPRLVGDLNEGLVSRFLAGMVVKVDSPDKDTRLEILRRKAAGLKLALSPEVADYIAVHIRGSVRELEGTAVKLSAIAALQEEPINLTLVREALSDHLARTDSATTLGDIEAVVAPFFGVTPADIHSSRRTKTVSAARMVAMLLARRYTPMSFPEIGRFMGKNHSSVVLAVQRIEQSINKDENIDWNTPAGVKSMPAKTILQLLEEQLNY